MGAAGACSGKVRAVLGSTSWPKVHEMDGWHERGAPGTGEEGSRPVRARSRHPCAVTRLAGTPVAVQDALR